MESHKSEDRMRGALFSSAVRRELSFLQLPGGRKRYVWKTHLHDIVFQALFPYMKHPASILHPAPQKVKQGAIESSRRAWPPPSPCCPWETAGLPSPAESPGSFMQPGRRRAGEAPMELSLGFGSHPQQGSNRDANLPKPPLLPGGAGWCLFHVGSLGVFPALAAAASTGDRVPSAATCSSRLSFPSSLLATSLHLPFIQCFCCLCSHIECAQQPRGWAS